MKDVYKILVPTDFTSVAETALAHAVKIAKIMDGEIVLLHVVDRDTKTDEARAKLDPMAEEVSKNENIPTVGKVVTGNIFDDIDKVADYEGARLIIMGTHGRKGIQHITGSYAMKVITNSKIPFIVVQDRVVFEGYKNIVFPIDFKAETKSKISVTASMANKLGAKVHIFADYEDDKFDKQKIDNNVAYTKKFFSTHGIDYVVEHADGPGDFVKQIIRYSASINADFIAILNLNYRSINAFLKNSEEALISNEAQIPVLMVNPSSEYISKSPLFGDYQTF
ncbi:MAG: nucleotide-binding universal stress UspA family protein [Flavobacteriales bacterium]|jgi:nucleotide-binding universal stress UspA family protein|tara:strand:- start:43 stop:882 length:840 start_codon:yes stop_codon:yes gene_type:complete